MSREPGTWMIIAVGVAVALLGEPLAGSMLMLGYEVGRASLNSIDRGISPSDMYPQTREPPGMTEEGKM